MANKLDSLNIEKSLNLFSNQVLQTYKQSIESNIEKLDFKQVIISGMGGSSNAGKLIQTWQEETNSIPLTIYNGYGLPGWVNEETLVVLNSYSGNTEETLSAYEVAVEKKCKIVGIATSGKVGELIKSNKIKGAIISAGQTNPSGYPKSGLGISLGALIGSLEKVGYLSGNVASEVKISLSEVENIRNKWNVLDIAKWIYGNMPVYFSSRKFLGALNAGRNATCEIGRTYTQFYDFPEVNHVLIEALMEPVIARQNRYLFFESNLDNDRIKLRYKITKSLFDEMGLTYTTYNLASESYLGQLLELSHYCAWIGYYLSILRNDDPGPEPWIIKLKNALSQPVH